MILHYLLCIYSITGTVFGIFGNGFVFVSSFQYNAINMNRIAGNTANNSKTVQSRRQRCGANCSTLKNDIVEELRHNQENRQHDAT